MNEPLIRLLGIARKAGRLSWGFDPIKAGLDKNIKLVLFASDLSEGSRSRIERLAKSARVPCLDAGLNMDELWFYIGKRAGIFAITDKGLAARAAELLTAADHIPAPKQQ